MNDPIVCKVGDKMFVKGGYYDKGRIEVVERVTPTGRFVLRSGTFEPNGRLRGGNAWSSTYASVATEDQIAGIYRHALVTKMAKFDWNKLSAEDLKTVNDIVNKHPQ